MIAVVTRKRVLGYVWGRFLKSSAAPGWRRSVHTPSGPVSLAFEKVDATSRLEAGTPPIVVLHGLLYEETAFICLPSCSCRQVARNKTGGLSAELWLDL